MQATSKTNSLLRTFQGLAVAALICSSAHAADYNYGSFTQNFTITANNSARAMGNALSTFNNQGPPLAVYWRGTASDVSYANFDLSSIAGGTINGGVNLNFTVDATYGGAINNGQVWTANSAWTGVASSATPGLTAITSSTGPNQTYTTGQTATWTIGNTPFQNIVSNTASFYGLAVSAGAGSQAHFNVAPTLTGNATTGLVRVLGGTDWSAASWDNGSSTLSVAGSSNVSGGNITIRSGATLSVADSATLSSGNFTGSIVNSGSLVFGSSANQTIDATKLSGSSGSVVTKTGAGTLTLTNDSAIAAGTWNINSGSVSMVGYFSGANLNVAGGSLNINRNGGGHFALGATSTTSLSSGTISSATELYLGLNGNSTVNQSGGTFSAGTNPLVMAQANGTAVYTQSGGVLEAGSIRLGASGGTATVNFNGGTVRATASGTTFMEGLTTANVQAGGLTVDSGTFAITVRQRLSGTGALSKAGTGTLTLSGTNAHSGGNTVSNGTLVISSTGGLGTGPTTVNSGANLNLSAGQVTYSGLSGTTAGTLAGSGTVNVSNIGTGEALTTLNGNYSSFGGTLNIGQGAAAGAGKVSMAGQMSGSATINVLANSTLWSPSSGQTSRPAAAVLYGGDTGESFGQLRLDGVTWSGPITVAGAITDANDAHIGVFTGASTISGTIGGSVPLTVLSNAAGGASVTFSAANTHSGGTILRSNSTLNIGNLAGLGSGTTTVNSGANLNLTVTSGANYSLALAGSGTVNLSALTNGITQGLGTGDQSNFTGRFNIGQGTAAGATDAKAQIAWTGMNAASILDVKTNATLWDAVTNATRPAQVVLNGGNTGEIYGQLRLSNGSNWSGPITIAGAMTDANDAHIGIITGAGANATVSGTISGSPTLSLMSAANNTITLSGNNTHTGDTVLTQATTTLRIASALALQNSTLSGTLGTVQFQTITSATFGGLASNRNLTLSNTGGAAVALAVGNNNQSTTYSGVLSGAGSLTKIGAGMLTLTGSSTFSGPTAISSGTLAVNGSIASAVNVANAAILGGTGTISGLVTVAGGGILAPGNSPGTQTMTAGLALADSSILNFELVATDTTIGGGINDLIVVTGNFLLDGVLNVAGAGDFSTVADNTKWRLFNYSGGTFTDGVLTLGTTPSVGASGKYFQIDAATAGQVNLVIVPEPGALALAGLGIAAAAWGLRRRA